MVNIRVSEGIARLACAQLVSTFGNWLSVIAAIGLVTFTWSSSPLAIAGVVASIFIPGVIAAPLAGRLVDRVGAQRLLVVSDLVRGALVLLFLVASAPLHLYAIFFALRLAGAVQRPGVLVLIPSLCRDNELEQANALTSQTSQLTRILSPALAAPIIALVGIKGAFVIDSATFVISALLVARLQLKDPSLAPTSFSRAATRLSLRSRIVGVGILAIAASAGFAILETGLPVLIRDDVEGKLGMYGLSVAAIGVGSIVGALLVATRLRKRDHLVLAEAGVAIAAAALLLLALLPAEWSLLLFVLLAGVGGGMGTVAAQTLVQLEVPANQLGQMSGYLVAVADSGLVLGILLAGSSIGLLGVGPSIFLASATLVLAVGFVEAQRRTASRPVSSRPRSLEFAEAVEAD